MAINRNPRVLFFIEGMTPTDEQREEADAMGTNVAFRNVTRSNPDEALEDFDKLAGEPPAWYLAAAAAKAGLPGVPVAPAVDGASDAGAALAGFSGAAAAPKAGSGGGWKPNA